MGLQPDREPKGNPPKIIYLCDREKECNKHMACGRDCKHTTDIRHAVNFINLGNENYVEERPERKTWRLIDACALKRALVTNGFRNDVDMMMTLETINNATTIDAISIPFIEEQAKMCDEVGFRRGEECYMSLIEKWREKNGTETD